MAEFSFVVPIYKVPYEFLKECIESILNQTYNNIELVLVDDGSPDDCGKICDDYAKKDHRVKVVHKANGGLSDARNAGTEVVSSQWIAYVDGDDWIDLDFAEIFTDRIATQEKKADIYIYSGCREYAEKTVEAMPYFEDGKRFISYSEREQLQIESCKVLTKERKEGLFIGSACGKVYNLSFLRNNHLKFTIVPYGEDSIFYFYSIEVAECIEYVTRSIYHYRDTDGSMTNKYRKKADEEQDIYLNEIFAFAKRYNKKDFFVDYLYYRVMISMQRCISQKFFNSDNREYVFTKQQKCKNFFLKKPYCDIFQYIEFKTLNKNGQIKYILFKLKLYFMLDISRTLYLFNHGARKIRK